MSRNKWKKKLLGVKLPHGGLAGFTPTPKPKSKPKPKPVTIRCQPFSQPGREGWSADVLTASNEVVFRLLGDTATEALTRAMDWIDRHPEWELVVFGEYLYTFNIPTPTPTPKPDEEPNE